MNVLKNLPFQALEPSVFPKEIQIQTHTRCQSRCVMCPYPEVSREVSHGRMTKDLFEKIIDECALYTPEIVRPFGFNEPLIDRRVSSFVRYARLTLQKTRIVLTTNAALLKGPIAEELLNAGLDTLWVSIPSMDETQYVKIKAGLSLQEVINNTLDFKRRIGETGSTVDLRVAVVELFQNVNEIEDIKQFWAGHGIAVDTTILNNRANNVNTDRLRVLKKVRAQRICDRPFYKMWILYNGDVVICSSDWRRTTIVGNVVDQSLASVWHGPAITSIRDNLMAGGAIRVPLCQNCDYVYVYE